MAKTAKPKNYEEAVLRLQEIVQQLETKEETLEDSMMLFEEGVQLSSFCYEKLEKAEQKVTEITTKKAETQGETE